MSALIFDKYEIQHRIAVGGMGEVFFAIQRGVSGFERPVILKSLLPDLAQQKELVNQFLDEARVAATLNHPNVVSIFEVGLWNGTFYLAMEYIRGRNLAQLLYRATSAGLELPAAVSTRIIREAALGLDHAHHATDTAGRPLNIVHRDISPQNIMLREDGVTKVVDFGIASAANRSTRTATGTVKGKLAYMAPEQVLGTASSPLVDQFALGVVFWELLMGRRLFKAENDLAIVKKLLEEPIPRPDTGKAAPQLADIVMRMLERAPERRFPSLAEAVDALEALSLPPGQSPAAFMRQLGTDDLKLEVKPTTTGGQNFVISLNQNPEVVLPSVEVQLATSSVERSPGPTEATRPSSPALPAGAPTAPGAAPAPRSRRPLLVAVAVVAAGGVALAVGLTTQRAAPAAPSAPVEAPRPPPVEPAPVAQQAAPVPPPPSPSREGTLELKTTPPGATLRLDGRPVGSSPQRVTLAPGAHYLIAELPGYEREEREVSLPEGAEVPVLLTLRARAVRPQGAKPPTPTPTPTPTPAPAEPAATGVGFVTIATTPWAKVSIDGDIVGSTPLYRVRLAPGVHAVQFVNEGEGINVTRSITVTSGENQRLQFKLP